VLIFKLLKTCLAPRGEVLKTTQSMKKILFTALCVTLLAQLAEAQTRFLLGGGLNVSYDKQRTGSPRLERTAFAFSPRMAVVQGNWWYGLDAQVQISDTEFNGSPYAYTGLGAGPFVRYVRPLGEHAGFWAEASARGEWSKTTSEQPFNFEFTSLDLTAAVRPGVIFFFGKHLSLEAGLGGLSYSHIRSESTVTLSTPTDSEIRQNVLDLSFNRYFEFGVNWTF
jgi:hypothetical protein